MKYPRVRFAVPLFESCLRFVVVAILLTFAVPFFAGPSARAQTYRVIHNFTGGVDGSLPVVGLTVDGAGNLYGTTLEGGVRSPNCATDGCGAVFKLSSPNWIFTRLYDFQGGTDGTGPWARVTFGPDGSLYGTTTNGGSGTGDGTFFRLRPPATFQRSALQPWTETVLYAFQGGDLDASFPQGDLIFDDAGNWYGTSLFGGSPGCESNQGCGTVYKLTSSSGTWADSIIYNFMDGSEGSLPEYGVISDSLGNLYGTAAGGGLYGLGQVFELTPSGSGWTETTLYSFDTPPEAAAPTGLIFDPSGNLYGATEASGPAFVFELSPSGSGWVLTTLYTFSLGFYGPQANLVRDSAGNLYGTSLEGGAHGAGFVFELMPSGSNWIYIDLWDFTGGTGGAGPSSTVLLHPNGKLYGTTELGGTSSNCSGGCGVVWEITP